MGCLEQGLSFNTKNSVLENVPKFSATVEDVSVSLKPRQNISDSTLKPSLICCKYICEVCILNHVLHMSGSRAVSEIDAERLFDESDKLNIQ